MVQNDFLCKIFVWYENRYYLCICYLNLPQIEMKNTIIGIVLSLVFSLMLTTSCEKGYYVPEEENKGRVDNTENNGSSPGSEIGDPEDEDNGDDGTEDVGGGSQDGDDSTESGDDSTQTGDDSSQESGEGTEDEDMMTVQVFMSRTLTGQRWVVGYIVGACSKTINNADFEPPFDYPQAILLADRPGETDKTKVITIGLPSGYKVRKELNLVEHPENYGKRLAIFGEQTTYLKVLGIKKPDAWKLY